MVVISYCLTAGPSVDMWDILTLVNLLLLREQDYSLIIQKLGLSLIV